MDGLPIKVPYSFQKKQRLKNRYKLEKNNNLTKKSTNEISNFAPVKEISEGDKSTQENLINTIQQNVDDPKKLKEENVLKNLANKQTNKSNSSLLKLQLKSIERLTSLPKTKKQKRSSFSGVAVATANRLKSVTERPQTNLNIRYPNVIHIGNEACKINFYANRNQGGSKQNNSFIPKISSGNSSLVINTVSGEKINENSETQFSSEKHFTKKSSNRSEHFLHNYLLNKKAVTSYDFTTSSLGKHRGIKNNSSKNLYSMPKLSLNTVIKVQKRPNLTATVGKKITFSSCNLNYNSFVETNTQEIQSNKISNDKITRLKTPKLAKGKPYTNTSTVVYNYQKKLSRNNKPPLNRNSTNLPQDEKRSLLLSLRLHENRLRTPATMRVLSNKYKDKYRLRLSSLQHNLA